MRKGAGISQTVQQLSTGWTARGSKLRWSTRLSITRSRPNRPWGPPSLLYNRYWRSTPEVNWLGCGVDNPPPPSAEVKNE